MNRKKFLKILKECIGDKARVRDNSGMVIDIVIEKDDIEILCEFYDREFSMATVLDASVTYRMEKEKKPNKKLFYYLLHTKRIDVGVREMALEYDIVTDHIPDKKVAKETIEIGFLDNLKSNELFA